MGLWSRKVCDNLASKCDTESISSQTSYTETDFGSWKKPWKTQIIRLLVCHISLWTSEVSGRNLLILDSTLVRNPINCNLRHSQTLYLCSIPQFYSSQDITNKKFHYVSFMAPFITMPSPLLLIKLYCQHVLTVISQLAIGRVELNSSEKGGSPSVDAALPNSCFDMVSSVWFLPLANTYRKHIKHSDYCHPGPDRETPVWTTTMQCIVAFYWV